MTGSPTETPRIPTVSRSDFDEVIMTTDVPVLVEFAGEWCRPCRTLEPVLADVAGDRAGDLKILKVDVDRSPELAGRYQVTSVPTMLLFVDGVQKDRLVGALPRADLVAALEPHLA